MDIWAPRSSGSTWDAPTRFQPRHGLGNSKLFWSGPGQSLGFPVCKTEVVTVRLDSCEGCSCLSWAPAPLASSLRRHAGTERSAAPPQTLAGPCVTRTEQPSPGSQPRAPALLLTRSSCSLSECARNPPVSRHLTSQSLPLSLPGQVRLPLWASASGRLQWLALPPSPASGLFEASVRYWMGKSFADGKLGPLGRFIAMTLSVRSKGHQGQSAATQKAVLKPRPLSLHLRWRSR